ncbi:MAG: SDR family oxidoreductase [Candidatus Nealsonbacteria bacterium]|nr:SDR family oxidoreductase [Candidatus Nealsonbacteria bacterium]
MQPTPNHYDADDLAVGMTAQFERDIGEADVADFAAGSGDFNPLHVDRTYAEGTNFAGRIVHGAFQIGLASALIGMHLPGRNVLLGSVDARFPGPLHYPARVRVDGQITAWNRQTLGGRLSVTVTELAGDTVTARIGMGFSMHEQVQREQPQPVDAPCAALPDALPVVLVTGASGGIGSQLVRSLSQHYRVVATVNRGRLPDDLAGRDDVQTVPLDFERPGWQDALAETLASDRLFAIVHCAWPGMPRGGLLDVPQDVIQRQLAFGTVHLTELAKLLGRHVADGGGRLIAVGSTAGVRNPTPAAAAYSLGKAALEQTVRLLACELASKRVTVNAVCPGFVPVGMNQQADDRRKKLEAAHTPLGRLCDPDDVAATVRWLLRDESSFVSGQIVALTGARL